MRRRKDVAITGLGARMYDRQGRSRQDEFRQLAHQLAQRIPETANVLEIAPGSGYLAIELFRLGRTKFVGMDISADQVEIAKANARAAGANLSFVVGNVTDIFLRKGAYSRDEMQELIAGSGFSAHELEVDGIGFTLRLTK